jgi:hypothetical protein
MFEAERGTEGRNIIRRDRSPFAIFCPDSQTIIALRKRKRQGEEN